MTLLWKFSKEEIRKILDYKYRYIEQNQPPV